MIDHSGILWAIFWQGIHLANYYTPEASEVATAFMCDIDIRDHRITLL